MISATKTKLPPPPPDSTPHTTVAPGLKGVASNNLFVVKANTPGDTGWKVGLYGPPGSGKSTIATLAPGAVVLDLNHGLTGLNANVVDVNVTSFDQLLSVLRAIPQFVPEGGTFVLDTISDVTALLIEHLKSKYDKKSVKELGFDFFPCAAEAFRLVLSALDPAVRAKRNILLLAHEIASNYKNSQGDDYRILGPNLPHAATGSCQGELMGWTDHMFRIALAEASVKVTVNAQGKITGGKVIGGSSARIITTDGTQSLIAKSRRIIVGGQSMRIPPQFALDGPDDTSLWEGLKDPSIFVVDEMPKA